MSRLHFAPLEKLAVMHTPCSLENVLHGGDAAQRLLARIPKLRIELPGKKMACCGAGGMAFISPTDLSSMLRDSLRRKIDEVEPDFVLSGNISCRMHLQATVEGGSAAYMHPVTLLAQQLIRD